MWDSRKGVTFFGGDSGIVMCTMVRLVPPNILRDTHIYTHVCACVLALRGVAIYSDTHTHIYTCMGVRAYLALLALRGVAGVVGVVHHRRQRRVQVPQL